MVETGVAPGITSRDILERLARAGQGQLWSIDLPGDGPSLFHDQLGVAIPSPESIPPRPLYTRGTDDGPPAVRGRAQNPGVLSRTD